jgi:hypothetical protein
MTVCAIYSLGGRADITVVAVWLRVSETIQATGVHG